MVTVFANIKKIFWSMFFQHQDFFLCYGKILLIKKHTYHLFTNGKGLKDTLQFVYCIVCISKVKMIESTEEIFASGKQLWRFFFSVWVFFHDHLRITGLQGKGMGISLTPHYHFHPLHRHLDTGRANAARSSSLHIASSRTRTGNLWFPSASR